MSEYEIDHRSVTLLRLCQVWTFSTNNAVKDFNIKKLTKLIKDMYFPWVKKEILELIQTGTKILGTNKVPFLFSRSSYLFAASILFWILILLAAILSSGSKESTDGPASSSSPLELIFHKIKLNFLRLLIFVAMFRKVTWPTIYIRLKTISFSGEI